MTPTQLLNDNITIQQNFSDMDWVVTSDFVIRHTFIFAGVLLIKEGVRNFFFQWNENALAIQIIRGRGCLLTTSILRAGFGLQILIVFFVFLPILLALLFRLLNLRFILFSSVRGWAVNVAGAWWVKLTETLRS